MKSYHKNSSPGYLTILIAGLEFYAYHGVPAEERSVGHRYQIDLELSLLSSTMETDDVEDSVDYGELSVWLVEYASKAQYKTLEKLAQSILDSIFNRYLGVESVSITLAKRLPPMPVVAASASVRLSRSRENGTPP